MSIYRFISAEKARTPVSLACQWLGVSRSGFYVRQADVPAGPSQNRRVHAVRRYLDASE